MEYFDSILMKMNTRLLSFIEAETIKRSDRLAILGLDEHSFAIRTLLVNQGYEVECYISEDEERREAVQRGVKHALSRYFNKTDAYIKIFSVDEWAGEADENWKIFYASMDCTKEITKITNIVKIRKVRIYCLYDWEHIEYKKKTEKLKRITIDELKVIEKGILACFDWFCGEHSLRYWLSGGSMLGTVRHKGFIPWDDDIDVFMPDVDYERFLELFKEDEYLRCQIVDDENDVWGHYKFVRLADKSTLLIEKYPFYNHFIGVNIEILPIVGLPRDTRERTAYIRQYEKFNARRREVFFQCSGDMHAFRRICDVESPSFETYRFDDSEYVGVLGTGYYEKDCTTRSVYAKTLRMPFEDIMVNVPQGYQEYLDNLYGKGWEEWPPENKRIFKHNIEAYWL
ncbi:MAG: LicD family protein [Ruminococcus flavefaciens]|nr:LicD family protein [Roseburia sp.]MCM1231435.1 LicD family protein [Ruminococcus flavefaciens]